MLLDLYQYVLMYTCLIQQTITKHYDRGQNEFSDNQLHKYTTRSQTYVKWKYHSWFLLFCSSKPPKSYVSFFSLAASIQNHTMLIHANLEWRTCLRQAYSPSSDIKNSLNTIKRKGRILGCKCFNCMYFNNLTYLWLSVCLKW